MVICQVITVVSVAGRRRRRTCSFIVLGSVLVTVHSVTMTRLAAVDAAAQQTASYMRTLENATRLNGVVAS